MSPEFEHVLRGHLLGLDASQPLDPAASLPELGLDSMASVALLLDLEEELGVTLPDSALTPETFATPESLWRAVVHEPAFKMR